MKKHPVNEWDNQRNSPRIAGAGQEKPYPGKAAIEGAGQEMKAKPPAILAKTAKKFGKARAGKQRVAIMLSKARRGK